MQTLHFILPGATNIIAVDLLRFFLQVLSTIDLEAQVKNLIIGIDDEYWSTSGIHNVWKEVKDRLMKPPFTQLQQIRIYYPFFRDLCELRDLLSSSLTCEVVVVGVEGEYTALIN